MKDATTGWEMVRVGWRVPEAGVRFAVSWLVAALLFVVCALPA